MAHLRSARARIVWLAALMTCSAAMIGGCGGDEAGGAGQTASGGSGSTDLNGKKVSVLLFSRGFEFVVQMDESIKAALEQHGMKPTVLDAKSDSATQTSQINDQIAAGADAVLLQPNDAKELVPGAKRVNSAGIPLVVFDNALAPGAKPAAQVAWDNKAAGALAADFIAESIGAKGKVLMLTGPKGAQAAEDRGGGFKQRVEAKYPGMEVLERDAQWDAAKALPLTVDAFTADPSIKAIYGHGDELLRGAVAGLQQVNKTAKVGEPGHVVMVGIDGTPSGMERIRSGIQDGSVYQDPNQLGKLTVDTFVKVLKKEPVPEIVYMPADRVVTKKDAADPALWGNKAKG